MSPSRPFILRPVATTLLMLAILLSGLIALRSLPLAALPEDSGPSLIAATLPIAIAALIRTREGHEPVRPDPSLSTATPRWLDFLRADALSLHKATAAMLVASRRLDWFVRNAPEKITLPVLLMLAYGCFGIAAGRCSRRLPAMRVWLAVMGVTAGRPYARDHYRATRAFGPNGCIELEVVSTTGSNPTWQLGDSMPTGVPIGVVAGYAVR